MPADLSHRIFILRREYLFQGLDTAQLLRIASFFDEVHINKGDFVFSQGDAPDNFYIILDGQVKVFRKKGKKVHHVHILGPGDYFGEQALMFNHPRVASVQAETDVLLLRLAQDQFQNLLHDYVDIRYNLAATAESRKMVRRLNFPWQDKQEVIYYITRKHPLFFLISMVGPGLTALFGVIVWILLGTSGGSVGFEIGTLILAIVLIILGMWGGWNWLDWSNDYYIVTNLRVVWQEKILILYDSRNEAPLNTVVSVNTTTSWLGRRLNYGDVEVRTYTGVIPMRKMSRPHLFASFVEGYRKRVQAVSKEQEDREIVTSLRSALLKRNTPPEILTPADEAPPQTETWLNKPPPPDKQETFTDDIRKALQTFLKVRFQEGNVITYRKHYLLLIHHAGVAFLLTLLSIFGLGWAIIARQQLMVLILIILFLGTFAWLVYGYMDWSNDIYRLTPEQIMDIEKKPLGREHKKTSNLDAPDFRVEHVRKNIINIIFNYGNVVVNVGQTQFTFDGVYNPDQVHQDVANYRAALQRKKQEDDNKRDREKMLDWLIAYYSQVEKLEKPENPENN